MTPPRLVLIVAALAIAAAPLSACGRKGAPKPPPAVEDAEETPAN